MKVQGSRRFGSHLRRLRERRGLSLDHVEELSTEQAGRVTRSHLSRIENGQALPTLPRLISLSRLYGERLSDLVARLQFDLHSDRVAPVDVTDRPVDDLEAEAKRAAEHGDLAAAIQLLEAASDRLELEPRSEQAREQRARSTLELSAVLIRSGSLATAREHAESVLTGSGLALPLRIWALLALATISYRLGRPALANLLLDGVLAFGDAIPACHHGDTFMLRGALAVAEGDPDRAWQEYAKALSAYRSLGAPFEESKALVALSRAHLARGHRENAERFIDTQLARVRDHGFTLEESRGLMVKALISADQGEIGLAQSLLKESSDIATRFHQPDILFSSQYHQWRLARVEGDESVATSLLGSLRSLRARTEEDTRERRLFDAEAGHPGTQEAAAIQPAESPELVPDRYGETPEPWPSPWLRTEA